MRSALVAREPLNFDRHIVEMSDRNFQRPYRLSTVDFEKEFGFREAGDASRPENEPERDLYRLLPETTVELYKLPNTLELDSAMPAKPGGSRT
jgi:hypothetical protein